MGTRKRLKNVCRLLWLGNLRGKDDMTSLGIYRMICEFIFGSDCVNVD